MNLIRLILINVENGKAAENQIEGFSKDQVLYHKQLVVEHNLAEGSITDNCMGSSNIPIKVSINKLTWYGHDFIEAIIDDSNWSKVKAFLTDAGKQITIETIKTATTTLFGFN